MMSIDKYSIYIIIGLELAFYLLATMLLLVGYKMISVAFFCVFIFYSAEHVCNYINRSGARIVKIARKYINTALQQRVISFTLPVLLASLTFGIILFVKM